METILIVYFVGLVGTILGFIVGNYVRSQDQTRLAWGVESIAWLLIAVLFWPVFAVALVLDILYYLWVRITSMKNFVMYTIVFLAILIFLAICTFASAESPLKISPPVDVFYPAEYPDNVSEITDAEFFEWATAKNKASRADWAKRYEAAGSPYLIQRRKTMKSRYTGLGGNRGVIVTGGSLGKTGGKLYSQQYEETYRFQNQDFRHPGPLTLVNPYVRPKK